MELFENECDGQKYPRHGELDESETVLLTVLIREDVEVTITVVLPVDALLVGPTLVVLEDFWISISSDFARFSSDSTYRRRWMGISRFRWQAT